MAGQPWKTADKVREVLETLYSAESDGLSGNEDVGQMSAWYILSSLGFYQIEPGSDRYWFGSPIFDKAEIKVPGGSFTVRTENNLPGNIYTKSITLNGHPYDKWYIDHKDIAAGGELVFVLEATATKEGTRVRICATETAVEIHRLVAATHFEYIAAE